jgi:hypothetical protein
MKRMNLLLVMLTFIGIQASAQTERKSEEQFDKSRISNWPKASQMAAEEMISKYGKPDTWTEDKMEWKKQAKWEKIVVSRMETPHEWPMAHTDVLEQAVNYRVPMERVDELSKFDGSVTYKRTQGLLSARCDKEAMNILALNLAVEVAEGKRSPESARAEFAKHATAFKKGEKPELTQKLMFDSKGNTADPDKPQPMQSMESEK